MGLKDKLLSAIGQGVDATRDLAGKAAGATKDFAGKAADKAKAGGRIAKLTVEIAKEKEDMKKTYLEIGKLYYDTHKDNPEGFFLQLCEEIALAEKTVAAKEAELEELKAGFNAPEQPDVEVEFEEVVGEAEAEAEGCCCAAEEAAEDAKCCCADAAEEAAEEAKCCCADAAEEAAEDAKCCCAETENKIDKAADEVRETAKKVVDAVADAAEKVVEKIKGDKDE